MQMAKNLEHGFLLILISFIFLASGCLQSSLADRCIGSPDPDGCLSFYAIWYQSPETCYSISSYEARRECMESATDPLAAQRLHQSYAAYGRITPELKPAQKPQAPSTASNASAQKPAPIQIASSQIEELISKCTAASPSMTYDSCAKQLAISQKDMEFCTKIKSSSVRSSCILMVATNLKDPKACEIFNITSEKQFCTYYSKAG